MKINLIKRILFILAIGSPFVLRAQNFAKPAQSFQGERKDTLIRFNNNTEYNYLPVTIIKGQEKGPVFTIVAGIHGYEYPPIIAVQELLKEINPAKLKGTLLILPIANIASFYKRVPFINPVDSKNLNNVFPGSATGTLTEQIAHWITRHIIPQSDVFLDIHGGDANEDLLPFICYYDRKDAQPQTRRAQDLSIASGMNYIVSYPYTITSGEPAKYAFKQAIQNGITALSIEAGKLGTVQPENVQLIKNAVYNMLDHMKMYTTPASSPPAHQPIILSDQVYIKVPVKGFFYSNFKSGDKVLKDQELGYITDDFGKTLYTILSPAEGLILYKAGTPPVNKDETLFCIGH